MTITFGAAGATASNAGNTTLALPAGIAGGELLINAVVNKYPANVPAISGFTHILGGVSGGVGTTGVDTGLVLASALTRPATIDDGGNVTITNVGNVCRGKSFRYTRGPSTSWLTAAVGGAQNSAVTNWSIAMASDPGFQAGDVVLAISAINTDAATWSAEALTIPGCTVGALTEREDSGTSLGDDMGLVIAEFPITAGTSSGNATYTMTGSAAGAGATLLLRLREGNPLNADLVSGVADSGTTLFDTSAHNVHYNSDVFLLTQGATDLTAPIISNIIPDPSTTLATKFTPIQFDVTDPGGLLAILVTIRYKGSNEQTIVIFDGVNFCEPFAGVSSRVGIAGGYQFIIIPKGGWIADLEMVHVYAVDIYGNLEGTL